MKVVSSNLCGGLGNYLFQIAAGYSLSLRDDKEYVCFLDEIQKGNWDLNCPLTLKGKGKIC